MENNETIIVMRWMCEYSLKMNLNGSEQQIVYELSTIVCIIYKFSNKHKVNKNKNCAYHFPFFLKLFHCAF